MPRIRLLVSMLCVAFAVAAALVKPHTGRAAGRATQPRRATRTTQFHLPFGTRVVDYARRFAGVRYSWGGMSPRTGFDCSGFVRNVYGHFGITLAHSSYAQFLRGRRVSRGGLRPGDLVFFDGLGHVGIYVGNGRFIHAPHTGTRVRVEKLAGWYGSRFDGARRLRTA